MVARVPLRLRRPGARHLLLAASLLVLGCPGPSTVVAPPDAVDAERQAILAASSLPETLADPLPDDPMETTIHRLSNGMTVYISPAPWAPRVSAWIGVRAGSRHDPAESTGLAHYLEHMLFKGTDEIGAADVEAERPGIAKIAQLYDELGGATSDVERAKLLAAIDAETVASAKYAIPGDYDRLYAALGVVGVNAYTTDDTTVYHARVPQHQLENWAKTEAERFSDPVYRLFYPELESVYEEKNISLDDPSDIVVAELVKGVYGEHPYGSQPTLGHARHLRAPAYADMEAQFERYYRPNNMAIAIVGNVTVAQVLPTLESAFGAKLEAAALPEPPTDRPTHKPGRTFSEVQTPGTQGINVAWPSVPKSHPDAVGLEVLRTLLVNGKSGLLEVALELPQLVPYVTSTHDAIAEGGMFMVTVEARADQDLAEVERLLDRAIADVVAGKFTDADVEIALNELERGELRGLESAEARAEVLLTTFAERREWRDVIADRARRASIDKDALVELARRTLGEDRTVVYRRDGTPEHPRLTQPSPSPIAAGPDRRSEFANAILERPTPPPKPRFVQENRDYEQRRAASGLVISTKNKRNELFTLKYRFAIGQRAQPLLCHAIEAAEKSGTAELSTAELARALAQLGASVSLRCGLQSTDVYIEGLDRGFEPALKLVHGWLDGLVIEPEFLERLTQNSISSRTDAMRDPDTLGAALFSYGMLGERSAWLLEPRDDELKAATPEGLTAILHEVLEYPRTTIYFGPRDASKLEVATQWRPPTRPAPEPEPERFVVSKSDRVFVIDRPIATANAYLHFEGSPLPLDTRAAPDVIEHYLSGDMASVVFQELRERRGLVYSSSAWFNEPDVPGDDVALFGSFTTGNDRFTLAAQVMLDTLRATPSAKAVQQRLESRRNRLRLDWTDPRFAPHRVASWLRAGFDADPKRGLWDQLGTLTLEGVETFATARTSGHYTFTVVGNRALMGELGELGVVVELSPSDVMNYGDRTDAVPAAR